MYKFSTAFLVFILALISCEVIETESFTFVKETIDIDSRYIVSMTDANAFVELYKKDQPYKVEPIVQEDDTLMYLYSFHPKGWLIISGDRRTTPIIGESSTDYLDLSNIPNGLRVWINSKADDLKNNTFDTNGDVSNKYTEMWNILSHNPKPSPNDQTPTIADNEVVCRYTLEFCRNYC